MLAKHFGLNHANRSILMGWLAFSCLGCSVCPSPYDYDFGTYGTKTPRTDMRHGRVGSILSDPVYTAGQSTIQGESYEVLQDGYEYETLSEPEIITDGIITEGIVSDEPQRVRRAPLRAPGQIIPGQIIPGQIIIE